MPTLLQTFVQVIAGFPSLSFLTWGADDEAFINKSPWLSGLNTYCLPQNVSILSKFFSPHITTPPVRHIVFTGVADAVCHTHFRHLEYGQETLVQQLHHPLEGRILLHHHFRVSLLESSRSGKKRWGVFLIKASSFILQFHNILWTKEKVARSNPKFGR